MTTPTTTAPNAPAPSALRTPAGLLAWRKQRKLSQGALGALLEVHWLTVLRWENGQVAIPRTVELALLYLTQRPGIVRRSAQAQTLARARP